MYKVDKSGKITINGWEKGIAPSPHEGIGDIKCGNISTEMGEVSANYSRVALTNVSVAPGGGTFTATNTSNVLTYPGTALKNGTWVLLSATTVTGFTSGHYYFVTTDFGVGSTSYQLSATFGGSFITAGSGGTLTFGTLNMSSPVDYAVELTSTFDAYRYYILDASNQIWVSGAGGVPGAAGRLSTTTVWSNVAAGVTSSGATAGNNTTGLSIIYGTTSGKITNTYIFAFGDGTGDGTNGIAYLKVASNGGSFTAGTFTAFGNTKYTGGFSHRAILGNDGVMYWCDGPNVYCIYQQSAATPFNPTDITTYSGTSGGVITTIPFFLNPTDAATRIAQIPSSGGVGIVVGGQQNNIYTYPSARFTTSGLLGQPSAILWMPESNTQYLLSTNNFVIIFCGSKGNIYLTNGSSVVPVLSVPDYVSGSASFQQEPYFNWGGAMYLRGRVWFSIQDTTATHNGNCGGVWSFVPNFAAFIQQDAGAALRLENHNASGLPAFQGYAPVIFAGQDTQAQGGALNNVNGPQYVAGWSQIGGTTAVATVDFSGTVPYTDGSVIIETDIIPAGTFTDKKTYSKIEYKLAALPATGDSVAINYRTSLESAFASAGTIQTEGLSISGYCPVAFQGIQLLQLQIVLTAASSNSSFVRLKEIYVHPD